MPSPLHVAVRDSKGLISGAVTFQPASATLGDLVLSTTATLPAGTHQTSLDIILCEDSSVTCAQALPGSPWHVPLKLEILERAGGAARVKLSIAALDMTTTQGQPVSVDFSATTRDLSDQPYQIGIVDPAGLILPEVRRTAGGFDARVTSSASVPAGVHTSMVEVRACFDIIDTCLRPIAGSPWLLPLTLTVRPAGN